MKLKFLTILTFLFLSAQLTSGQCPPLHTFTGSPGSQFGYSVSSAGDVNGDGCDDLIVGAYNIGGGQVYVYSGKTGATLHFFDGFTSDSVDNFFGFSVSGVGDIDKDGFDDIIIGAPQNSEGGPFAGRVYVFSGQTGDTIYVFTGESSGSKLGWSVASAGDVDNDSYNDLMIGGRLDGRVYVISGQTGDTLHLFIGEEPQDWFGQDAVNTAGDVNNDGYADLLIGASGNDSGGSNAGILYVFSGKTGDTLHVFIGHGAQDQFGRSASTLGDVDNDGYDDLIIGARFAVSGGISAGRAYVFSGQTGDTIYIYDGEAQTDLFGGSVSVAGDLDGDGINDFIIGAHGNDGAGAEAGRVYAFSGSTGDTICVFSGESGNSFFGHAVSFAGDVNGDGADDVIIGAYKYSIFTGRAYVYLGFDTTSCCVGNRGDVNGDDDDADILDLTYLVDFIFRGGPPADCDEEADVNSDDTPSNILDLTYLVDFIFRGGPAPGGC